MFRKWLFIKIRITKKWIKRINNKNREFSAKLWYKYKEFLKLLTSRKYEWIEKRNKELNLIYWRPTQMFQSK